MRIAVISPHTTNNGNTALAMLLGLTLASSGHLTCLTHVKPVSNSFERYLSFSSFVDKTSTPSQIVKILQTGALTGDEVRDYCKNVSDNLEAFTNTSDSFSDAEMKFMLQYIGKAFPHENVIFDMDSDDEKITKLVIKMCDLVILNITQSVKDLTKFRDNKDQYLALMQKKPTLVVVNRFNSTSAKLTEVAKWLGVKKPNNWLILRENPWITWATNHGRLNELYRSIKKKDSRVVEISYDLDKMATAVAKAKLAGRKSS